jgi:putative NADH-flavin reductase
VLLAVFGATGGTGLELTRQALERGHKVVALARRPEAVQVDHPALRVVGGDVLVPDAVHPVVAGADAVISALGIGLRRHTTTVYSQGTGNILAAMAGAGVGRLLVVSTSSLQLPEPREVAEWLLARFVLHPMLRRPYSDMAMMEELVRCSNTAWTVVRAARLTNGRRTGKYRTAVNRKLRSCWSISRADLASFLLDHALDERLSGTVAEIAY